MQLREPRWLLLSGALAASCGNGDGRPPTDNGDAATSDVRRSDATTPLDVRTSPDVTSGTDAAVDTDVPGNVDAPRDTAPPTDATDVVIAPPSCSSPVRALTLPADTAAGTLGAGAGTVPTTHCRANAGGAEQVYTLHIASRTGVDLETTSGVDTVLSVRTRCTDATSEVACDDNSGRRYASRVRAMFDPGDYFVIVDEVADGAGKGGDYTLTVATFAPAANGVCASAEALTLDTPATGDTSDGVALGNVCSGRDAPVPALFYALTAPARSLTTVTATPTGAPAWAPVVYVTTGCDATVCTADTEADGAGTPAAMTLANTTDAARALTVAVTANAAPGGAFTLTASATALPPAAANSACTAPATLTPGAAATGNIQAGTEPNTQCEPSDALQLFYALAVPPHNRATLTATPMGAPAWPVALRVLDRCADATCVASATSPSAGAAASLALDNGTAVARTIIVSVSGPDVATAGTVSLLATLAALP